MKTGFFGGAFDPFHNEHRHIIECAKDEAKLDRVVVYTSFLPPHKSCTADFGDRAATVGAGIDGLTYAISDTLEKDRAKINPTCEILPILKRKYPSDEYFFIIGGDSMLNFSRWIRPDLICGEAKIVVAARVDTDGLAPAEDYARKNYGAEIINLDFVGKDISSSEIKAKAEFGDPIDGVSDAVAKIIEDRKMYRNFSPMIEKLRSEIPDKTFRHVKRTVFYALKLNTKLGLDFDKVFTAALLHDCAKHMHRTMDGVPSAVEHQFLGAEVARDVYGVDDAEILSAINYHTTGKPAMTNLEKLIFCADMLEEGRSYPGVEELRASIESDFQKGFVDCVNGSLKKLIEDGAPFHPLTKACAEYYNK
jgi:nicotinate-nucleotide adenylyltransferase